MKLKKFHKRMTNCILHMILFLGLFAITSCVVIFPSTRYENLTEDQKNRVVVCHSPIDSLTNDGNVYLVTIHQLHPRTKYSFMNMRPSASQRILLTHLL